MLWLNLTFVLLLTVAPSAQVLLSKPPAVQRVKVETGSDAGTVRPGGTATLWVDVTPNPNIHVYAEGATGFTPIVLAIPKMPGLVAGPVKYPAAERLPSPGLDEPVPVYAKRFRITQPVTISRAAKPGDTLSISGLITYESCDDRLCYPSLSIPVSWMVTVR